MRTSLRSWSPIVVLAVVGLAVPVRAEIHPLGKVRAFVAQPLAELLPAGGLAVWVGSRFGRRLGRPADGFVEALGFEFAPAAGWELDGELAWSPSTPPPWLRLGARYELPALARLAGTRLVLGLDLVREQDGVGVLLGRASLGRAGARWAWNAAVEVERAFAVGRDALDVTFWLGGAYRLDEGVTIGLEGGGADLEAFWEPEEAEGGARFGVGPTVTVRWLARHLHLGLSGLYGLATLPRPTPSGGPPPLERAYLAQARLTWTF